MLLKIKIGAQIDDVSCLQSNCTFYFLHTNNIVLAFFCLGGEPYKGIKARDVVYLLGKGYRMRRPKHVDKEL